VTNSHIYGAAGPSDWACKKRGRRAALILCIQYAVLDKGGEELTP